MIKSLLFLFSAFSFTAILGQANITSWIKTDTIKNSNEVIRDVLQMPDSGFVLAGYATTPAKPFTENLLIRTDKNGDTLWKKIWGTNAHDGINTIARRPAGGFVAAGSGASTNFIFLDAQGNVTSTRNFGNFTFFDVVVLADSGFIFTGHSGGYPQFADVGIMRTNKNGDSLWSKKYGTVRADIGRAITATSDGNFVIAGEANFESYPDGTYIPQRAYVLKIDPAGGLLWSDTIPGTKVIRSVAWDVLENVLGEYVIAGWSSGSNGLMAAFTSSGSLKWHKEYVNPYTGTGFTSYLFYSIEQRCNGGYVAAGYWNKAAGSTGLLVSTNITGDTLYTRSYGSPGNTAFLRSIIRTLDNGYLIGGYTGSPGSYSENALLVKLDGQGTNGNLPSISSKFTTTISTTTVTFKDISAGAIKWNWDFGDGKVSTIQNPTHTFSVSGNYTVCLTTFNYCDTASYCEVMGVKKATTQLSENSGRLPVVLFFPQPSKDHVTFIFNETVLIPGFRVYDIAGRVIVNQVQVNEGRTENEYVIDVSELQEGVYIFESEFISGAKCRTKMIVNR